MKKMVLKQKPPVHNVPEPFEEWLSICNLHKQEDCMLASCKLFHFCHHSLLGQGPVDDAKTREEYKRILTLYKRKRSFKKRPIVPVRKYKGEF